MRKVIQIWTSLILQALAIRPKRKAAYCTHVDAVSNLAKDKNKMC